MSADLGVRLVGDELVVPCVDGEQRIYLSLDSAASTAALPAVADGVNEFLPGGGELRLPPGPAVHTRVPRRRGHDRRRTPRKPPTVGARRYPATCRVRRLGHVHLSAISGIRLLGDVPPESLPVAAFVVDGVRTRWSPPA